MLTILNKNDCMAGFIFVLIILVDAFQFKFKFKIVDYNATHNKDKIQHLCLFILKFCSIIANQIVISCPFIVNTEPMLKKYHCSKARLNHVTKL